ncbi:microtubule associated protein [Cryptosporidium felis]|nr:microtubule associated protein [Cryptosporidium felis]
MECDKENVQIISEETSVSEVSEYFNGNSTVLNISDLSNVPLGSLITSSEWQMREYGYNKMIREIDKVNVNEFESIYLKNIINDKNVSVQNLGLKLITLFVDKHGSKISSLPEIWEEVISELLIKKTLSHHKTSNSSINLLFSFFEQSLLLENGDLSKTDYLWIKMFEFINCNKKPKGMAIKQLVGILKLFLSFIENYGIALSPISQISKTIASVLIECTDKTVKEHIFEILALIDQDSPLMVSIKCNLIPLQVKEIQKKSLEFIEKKNKGPIKIDFINKIKIDLNQEIVTGKEENNKTDQFDLIEPVDVMKMLPTNWLETISDKEIKWNERKLIIDQFCKLCETHKRLPIFQFESKMSVTQNNKKSSSPSIIEYQNLFGVLQRIIKFEGNTTLILSVIRLCSNLIRCLREKISGIIRPITIQIMTKLKDQNKMVCHESTNYINITLKYSLTLDQVFEELSVNGFKEKVATAKCSAISICNVLIDDIVNGTVTLEKHFKGLKQLVSIIPLCLDDPSAQVRSSASILLIKLKATCFGQEINANIQRVILGLSNNKVKLINDIERKLGIRGNTKNDCGIDNPQSTNLITSETFKTIRTPQNSTRTTPNSEKIQENRHLMIKAGLSKHPNEITKQDSKYYTLEKPDFKEQGSDQKKYLAKSNTKSKANLNENINGGINLTEIHNSETFPTILHSFSVNNDSVNFYEKISNNKRTANSSNINEKKNSNKYYIDPIDKMNYIIQLPENEMKFEFGFSDFSSSKEYIKTFISENLFEMMLSSDIIKINHSISFWERFTRFIINSKNNRFTLFYFFFSWITNHIHSGIGANYDRIIIALIRIFTIQELEFIRRNKDNIIFNLFILITSIINNELFCFSKPDLFSRYEIYKYEGLILLLLEGNANEAGLGISDEVIAHTELTNMGLLLNTVLIISLEDNYANSENKINSLTNFVNAVSNCSDILRNYGVGNIYSLLVFIEQNLSKENVDKLSNTIFRISSLAGAKKWNIMLQYLPNIETNKYIIAGHFDINDLVSNLEILNSLEYETLRLFNVIGSTGNPKDTGSLLYISSVTSVINKIVINLQMICNKLDYLIERSDEAKSQIYTDKGLNLLLVEYFNQLTQISIHVHFLLTNLEIKKFFELKMQLKQIGGIFFAIIEHIDKFTNIFQVVVTMREFPIHQIMTNTLYIMSNYLYWKEHICDDTQKVNLVNSLNNVMGVNIIASFQGEFPRLMRIIVEVVVSGIKSKNQTIFDQDLLNRLLPKVMRRMKTYLTQNNISDENIQDIYNSFEFMMNSTFEKDDRQLIQMMDFTLDYLLLLMENGLEVDRLKGELSILKMLNSFSNEIFEGKLMRIRSLL